MTAKELLRHQFDDAGHQLDKVYEGVDSSLDSKLSDSGRSPRETAAHLAECYSAILKEANGEKHEWGSFQPASNEWPALWNEMKSLREQAKELALQKDGWEEHAIAYGPAHDYYHVGQLAALRITKDPEWDPYSIYNMG
jgi:hypothetical protein